MAGFGGASGDPDGGHDEEFRPFIRRLPGELSLSSSSRKSMIISVVVGFAHHVFLLFKPIEITTIIYLRIQILDFRNKGFLFSSFRHYHSNYRRPSLLANLACLLFRIIRFDDEKANTVRTHQTQRSVVLKFR